MCEQYHYCLIFQNGFMAQICPRSYEFTMNSAKIQLCGVPIAKQCQTRFISLDVYRIDDSLAAEDDR